MKTELKIVEFQQQLLSKGATIITPLETQEGKQHYVYMNPEMEDIIKKTPFEFIQICSDKGAWILENVLAGRMVLVSFKDLDYLDFDQKGNEATS